MALAALLLARETCGLRTGMEVGGAWRWELAEAEPDWTAAAIAALYAAASSSSLSIFRLRPRRFGIR